jgi:FkbM family methyltransferase
MQLAKLAKLGQLIHTDFRRVQARKLAAAAANATLPNLELFGVRDGKNLILCHSKVGHITNELLSKSHFQRDDLIQAVRILHNEGFTKRGVFVDVGANIGTQTIYALQTGAFSHAACFEPEPENFRLLRANLALNALDQMASTFQTAVSDTTGTVEFELSTQNIGDHRVSLTKEDGAFDEKTRNRITVSRAPLDDLLATAGITNSEVALLWTDTEGHEDAVLAGASGLIASDVPVFLEFWPYALERSGGTKRLVDFMKGAFTHFYDMVELPNPRRRPIGEIHDVVTRLTGTQYTDILAFRSIKSA